MTKGSIGITTDNIFPVIKKFLYSDHEIFLRELVSNAVDATQKLRTLAAKGEFNGDLTYTPVRITVGEDTITVSDNGLGMTEEEVDKYINQIAFSGANDFLEKYKDDATSIIGHFGLGFYSAFMVAKQVDIVTRSYRPEAQAVKWTCDGSPSFEITPAERAEHGTDVILHIDDDCKEFLEKSRIEGLLKKYCRFLPVPIVFGKKTKWEEGKQVETDEDNVIGDTTPLWTKAPASLADEDYRKFYRDLYPMADEPLFWIHLNVDYPFHLTGVLYFPKIKSNIELQRNKIQLYCNQVYVTDQVDNIVPDFLTLLHGVIDSPDIPLNVSRSYLQSDKSVKQISQYITKKVSDRLQSIFKNDRAAYEEKWEALKLFIHYGMLTQEDFYDKAKAYALFTDTEGKHFTYDEYTELIKTAQTDKDGNIVYLYAADKEAQCAYIHTATEKGYSVLMMDGQLDSALVGMLEQKMEKVRFVRVDGDTLSHLIPKEGEETKVEGAELLGEAVTAVLPTVKGAEFRAETQALGEDAVPVLVTQSEYMRRMKEMSRLQAGMSFYGEMPDMYTLVLNTDHCLVKTLLASVGQELTPQIAPFDAELKGLEARRAALEQKKDDEEAKKSMVDCRKAIDDEQAKRRDAIAAYAKGQKVMSQLIDLALLQGGLLRGEALTRFVQRSLDLLA